MSVEAIPTAAYKSAFHSSVASNILPLVTLSSSMRYDVLKNLPLVPVGSDTAGEEVNGSSAARATSSIGGLSRGSGRTLQRSSRQMIPIIAWGG